MLLSQEGEAILSILQNKIEKNKGFTEKSLVDLIIEKKLNIDKFVSIAIRLNLFNSIGFRKQSKEEYLEEVFKFRDIKE